MTTVDGSQGTFTYSFFFFFCDLQVTEGDHESPQVVRGKTTTGLAGLQKNVWGLFEVFGAKKDCRLDGYTKTYVVIDINFAQYDACPF